jgi:hypothetical protein
MVFFLWNFFSSFLVVTQTIYMLTDQSTEITFTIEFSSVEINLKAEAVSISATKFYIPRILIADHDKLPFLEDLFIEKVRIKGAVTWVHSHNDEETILSQQIGKAIDLHINKFITTMG